MNLGELGPRERSLLRLYVNCQLEMSHTDFYAKWNVSHATMARICQCSESTVNHWFSQGKRHQEPQPIHRRRLAEMDILWEHYEEIPPALRQRICSSPR
jgi:uncharacterized membrane protein